MSDSSPVQRTGRFTKLDRRAARGASTAPSGGEGCTIRDHQAILRLEPYAAADTVVTATALLPLTPT